MSIKECRYPTCGAVQSWRDECRRCGTDISLLRRLADESRRLQGELLDAQDTGNSYFNASANSLGVLLWAACAISESNAIGSVI